MRFRAAAVLLASLLAARCSPFLSAQGTPTRNTAVVARKFEALRHDPARLLLFLRDMPKGGDLHNHLGGAIYAESMIAWAGADGLCIVATTFTLAPPPCDASAGRPPATTIASDSRLYNSVIDAWSMRNWDHARIAGHDQFFQSFAKFGLANDHHFADMLAEVTSRAASDRVSYLELMQTLDGSVAIGMGARSGYSADFGVMRERLLRAGLRDSLIAAREHMHFSETRRRIIQRCHEEHPDPGCVVTVRFIYQVLRGLPPDMVFAQMLTGFELASSDLQVVGLNLVMPEDDPVPMRDFSLHMRMLDYLHKLYPAVHITLHAGELAEGLVPPEGLRFHITESVGLGHAERIGHGVAVLHEEDADSLLRYMAAHRVLVEISLSSNDGILGVRGNRHPLATYLRYGVPVALSTDDEGVSRSNMTHEYQRAVEEQGLSYVTLRTMARNSLVYSFAEPAMKARLLREFDAAVVKFEARWGGN